MSANFFWLYYFFVVPLQTIERKESFLLILMNEVKTYYPDNEEETMAFMQRVISQQPDREPLRIVKQLVEIAMDELKEQSYRIWADASVKQMNVYIQHDGRPIDERMVLIMGDHTDHVDYDPVNDNNGSVGGWLLTIRRDIPPAFVTRR